MPPIKIFLMILLSALPQISEAASIVELNTAAEQFTGTPVVYNKQVCWLAAKDGSYSHVLFRDVVGSKRLNGQFHPYSTIQLKSQLQKELGKSFEVTTSGRFVIAAPTGKAKSYAKILDNVSRSFSHYSSVRNLPVKPISYPLVTIVYPNQLEFVIASREQGINATRTLKGYYHPWTNRIHMFEELPLRGGANSRSRAEAETISTLIHEAIHQQAFNQGLHSRVGVNPRWVVEGLANMLEVNIDAHDSNSRRVGEINVQRLLWFNSYREKSRKETVAEFIMNDEQFFQTNALDANSQAWALTYFLSENHSSAYASYLKIISERDPLKAEYSAEDRLTDFQNAFGHDVAWIEVQFLRYIDQLQVD